MAKGVSTYHSPINEASFTCADAPPWPQIRQIKNLPEQIRTIFPGQAGWYVDKLICLALDEDGPDLTSLGVFSPSDQAESIIYAKEDTIVAGLPLLSLIFLHLGLDDYENNIKILCEDGQKLHNGEHAVLLTAPTVVLLKAERVMLNLLTHLSGIANLTRQYAQALPGTGVRLLDTRKTTPGQRYLDKYAVRMGGGWNHRMNLADMLMLKDTHIDAAGSISLAVEALRTKYRPCPPLEIECRNREEVLEAVAANPERIMLDNIDAEMLSQILPLVPKNIEAEISGGVTLENIRQIALSCPVRPPDFISVGRITHSAPAADFSMIIRSAR